MLFKIVYVLVCGVLSLMVLVFRGDLVGANTWPRAPSWDFSHRAMQIRHRF